MTDTADRLVQVAILSDLVEAYILKGLLEGEGLTVFLFDEHAAGYTPFVIGGVRLMVREADLERAKEILREQ